MDAAQAARIANAQRVSNPGCYPTGAIALLRPLVQASLLPANHALNIHAVSGYSGGGRARVQAHEVPRQPMRPPSRSMGCSWSTNTRPIAKHAGLSQRPFFLPSYGAFRQHCADRRVASAAARAGHTRRTPARLPAAAPCRRPLCRGDASRHHRSGRAPGPTRPLNRHQPVATGRVQQRPPRHQVLLTRRKPTTWARAPRGRRCRTWRADAGGTT